MGDYSITFSGRFHYKKGEGVALHLHENDYQIQLIYEGKASVKVDDCNFFLTQGEILFLKKGSVHQFTSISDEGMKTLEIKFSNPEEDVIALIDNISMTFPDRDNIIYSLFSQIVEEGYKKMPDYKLMSTTLLTQSLLQMKRICSANIKESYNPILLSKISLKSDSKLLQAVTDYVCSNIGETFTINDLSKSIGYNQDYLYRCIMKETGLSTIGYINSIRFEEAKHLIQYTDLSLSEISWTLGFSSLQYFSRFFKKKAKMTPTEYLARTRNRIRTDY